MLPWRLLGRIFRGQDLVPCDWSVIVINYIVLTLHWHLCCTQFNFLILYQSWDAWQTHVLRVMIRKAQTGNSQKKVHRVPESIIFCMNYALLGGQVNRQWLSSRQISVLFRHSMKALVQLPWFLLEQDY